MRTEISSRDPFLLLDVSTELRRASLPCRPDAPKTTSWTPRRSRPRRAGASLDEKGGDSPLEEPPSAGRFVAAPFSSVTSVAEGEPAERTEGPT